MCLAVVIRPQGKPSKAEMETAFHQNPHGAGFAYISAETGEIIVYRTMSGSFRKLWRALNRARAQAPMSQFLLHFRFATHGKKDEANCHPFLTDSKSMAVIHNGVMSNWADWGAKDESDTLAFVREGLSPLESELDNPAVNAFLEKSTKGSKVAMLTKDNRIRFFHEGAGTWIKDVWYSNLHHAYAAAAGHLGYYGLGWGKRPKRWQGHYSNRPQEIGYSLKEWKEMEAAKKRQPTNTSYGPTGREMGSVGGPVFDFCPPRLTQRQEEKALVVYSKDEDQLDKHEILLREMEWEQDLTVSETDELFGQAGEDDAPGRDEKCWYCGEETVSTVRLDGAIACEECQLEFALASNAHGDGPCGI